MKLLEVLKLDEMEINVLSGISQTQKNKYCIFSLKFRVWNEKLWGRGSQVAFSM